MILKAVDAEREDGYSSFERAFMEMDARLNGPKVLDLCWGEGLPLSSFLTLG